MRAVATPMADPQLFHWLPGLGLPIQGFLIHGPRGSGVGQQQHRQEQEEWGGPREGGGGRAARRRESEHPTPQRRENEHPTRQPQQNAVLDPCQRSGHA